MKKLYTNLKNTITNKYFIYFLLISILFFGDLNRIEYATDTYNVFKQGGMYIFNHFLSCGRIVTALAYGIVYKFQVSDNIIYIMSFILGILSITISQYKVFNLIKNDIKNNIIGVICSVLIILNLFSIELFLFIEKGIMVFSVLMCVMACEQLVKYFENKKIKNIIISCIYMFIANCCYQGTIAIFVIISLVFIIKYSKTIKDFVKNNIIAMVCYGIPTVLNYLLIKIFFASERVSGNINFSESIKKVIEGTKNMIGGTYELFPKYAFFGIIVICIITLIIYILKNKEFNIKRKIIEMLKIIYILAGIMVATILPQLMQDTNSIWFVARSTYGFASIIGILLLYLCINFEIKENIKKAIIVIFCIFLSIQYISFSRVITDRYILNYVDTQITNQIGEMIYEYEKETGIPITKIAIYKDKMPGYSYPNLHSQGDTNIKLYSPDWCTVYGVNYILNKDLQKVEQNEQIKEKFEQRNWDYFDKEQVIFENDTIHICSY